MSFPRAIIATCLFPFIVAGIAVAGPRPDADASPLRVTLAAAPAALDGSAARIDVAVTNTAREPLRVTRWELASGYLDADLFDVELDGKRVAYTSRLVRRGSIPDGDFVVVEPGQTLHDVVDLSLAYDLGQGGVYTIAFRSPLHYAGRGGGGKIARSNGLPFVLQSAPLSVRIPASDARRTAGTTPAPLVASPLRDPARIDGLQNCNAEQSTIVNNAIASTRTSSLGAYTYLDALAAPYVSVRYARWFGIPSDSRVGLVRNVFYLIYTTFTPQATSVYCYPARCPSNVYGYVYPNDPSRVIYLCNTFFAIPNERVATLIHEMSHFYGVGSTEDYAYGVAASTALAVADPARAVRNADSYAYFAINTLMLP